MTRPRIVTALGYIDDDLILDAVYYKGKSKYTAEQTKQLNNYTRIHSHRRLKRILLIAAVIAGILMCTLLAYAIIRQYTTTIENTTLYVITDNGRVTASSQEQLTPEAAAYELARLFMDDLKKEDPSRTFRITEYEDLRVEAVATMDMDVETAAIYNLQEEEKSENTWVVEIYVRYRYEGILSPIGPSNGEWIDVLYQASPIGFLMTKDDNSYSLQSRYG